MLEGHPRIRRCIGAIFLAAAGATQAQPASQAASRTLEVAQILPRNGPLASVGNEIWAITQAAFDEFNSRPGAEARLKLERAGLTTYTHVAETSQGKRIRVRMGPFATRAEADKAAARAKALGLPAALLWL